MTAVEPVTGMSRRRWLAIGVLLAALLVHALWAASAKVTSDDAWWDMAAGRYIVEHRALPEGDVFSYTHPGAAWQNGEWLAHVVFFELHEVGGGPAVAAFKFALLVVVFGLVAWTGWRRSDSIFLSVGAAIFASYVCHPYFDIRSQLFLFLNATAMIAVLEAYRRGARSWVLALLVPTMVVWVNAHYSFLFGGGVLLLYAGGEVLKSWLGLPDRPMRRDRVLLLCAAVVVTLGAILVNPYFFRALTYPFLIVGRESIWREEVLEWFPTKLFVQEDFNPAIFGYFFVLQVGAAVAALVCGWRRFDLTDGLLVTVTAVMALSARRFVPLFALVSTPFLAQNLAILRRRFLPRPEGTPELAMPWSNASVSLVAIALTALLVVRAVPQMKEDYADGVFEGLVGADYFPRAAAEFLHRNEYPARLFNAYTWGGYLMIHLPERKVFIDGRAQTVYRAESWIEYESVERGTPSWSEVLDHWQVSLVLWPSSSAHGAIYAPLLRLLSASPEWLRIYDDGHAAVFAQVERGHDWVEAFRHFTLKYPEVSGAQMFLVNTYMNGNDFAAAHDLLEAAMTRFPQARESAQKAEQAYLQAAQTQNSAAAWFGLGFFRDVNGDEVGAATAFRTALSRGLAEPNAVGYARRALDRLPPPV